MIALFLEEEEGFMFYIAGPMSSWIRYFGGDTNKTGEKKAPKNSFNLVLIPSKAYWVMVETMQPSVSL